MKRHASFTVQCSAALYCTVFRVALFPPIINHPSWPHAPVAHSVSHLHRHMYCTHRITICSYAQTPDGPAGSRMTSSSGKRSTFPRSSLRVQCSAGESVRTRPLGPAIHLFPCEFGSRVRRVEQNVRASHLISSGAERLSRLSLRRLSPPSQPTLSRVLNSDCRAISSELYSLLFAI